MSAVVTFQSCFPCMYMCILNQGFDRRRFYLFLEPCRSSTATFLEVFFGVTGFGATISAARPRHENYSLDLFCFRDGGRGFIGRIHVFDIQRRMLKDRSGIRTFSRSLEVEAHPVN
jgi:hypothetical protein